MIEAMVFALDSRQVASTFGGVFKHAFGKEGSIQPGLLPEIKQSLAKDSKLSPPPETLQGLLNEKMENATDADLTAAARGVIDILHNFRTHPDIQKDCTKMNELKEHIDNFEELMNYHEQKDHEKAQAKLAHINRKVGTDVDRRQVSPQVVGPHASAPEEGQQQPSAVTPSRAITFFQWLCRPCSSRQQRKPPVFSYNSPARRFP